MSNKPYDQVRSSKVKDALIHYAQTLENRTVETILQNDGIKTSGDARALASFFWKMVDQTVIDADNSLVIAGYTNLESLCEDVMQSLRSHFIATGHMEIWEEESDKA